MKIHPAPVIVLDARSVARTVASASSFGPPALLVYRTPSLYPVATYISHYSMPGSRRPVYRFRETP